MTSSTSPTPVTMADALASRFSPAKPWVAYTRVSSEEQTLGHSMQNQALICRDFASKQSLQLLEIIEDAGVSGKNMTGRPGMQRLRELVRAGLIGGILVAKLDRLSRSLMDMLTLVTELEQAHVELQCVLEPLETRTPTGKLHRCPGIHRIGTA